MLSLLPHLPAGMFRLCVLAPGEAVSRTGRTMLHLFPLFTTFPHLLFRTEEGAEVLRQHATQILGDKAKSWKGSTGQGREAHYFPLVTSATQEMKGPASHWS